MTNLSHLIETATRGTRFPEDQDGPELRYPGYLGEDYEPDTGTLVIYGIHREFHSSKLINDPGGVIDQFLDAGRQLKRVDEPTDADLHEYAVGHRPMYEIGLSGGWNVSSHLVEALPACGVPFSRDGMRRIAYMNVSCCQFPELHKITGEDNRRKRWLKTRCSVVHPAAEVVTLLRPAVVLCVSSQGYRALDRAKIGGQLATVFYNQNGGYLQQPIAFPDGDVVAERERRAVWTEALRSKAASAGLHQ